MSVAATAEAIFESDVLNTIFSELCQHENSTEYVNFLFKDMIDTKFSLDEISVYAA